MIELVPLKEKETPEHMPPTKPRCLSVYRMKIQKKTAICKLGGGSSPIIIWASTLDFPASRIVRNKCLLFKPP